MTVPAYGASVMVDVGQACAEGCIPGGLFSVSGARNTQYVSDENNTTFSSMLTWGGNDVLEAFGGVVARIVSRAIYIHVLSGTEYRGGGGDIKRVIYVQYTTTSIHISIMWAKYQNKSVPCFSGQRGIELKKKTCEKVPLDTAPLSRSHVSKQTLTIFHVSVHYRRLKLGNVQGDYPRGAPRAGGVVPDSGAQACGPRGKRSQDGTHQRLERRVPRARRQAEPFGVFEGESVLQGL